MTNVLAFQNIDGGAGKAAGAAGGIGGYTVCTVSAISSTNYTVVVGQAGIKSTTCSSPTIGV